ncbi:MAG: hypothetical protein ACOZQL_03100 [Myxococcota bacterium]
MSRLLLALCCLLAVSACRKKSSDEFFKLEAAATMLVDRDGDDAWASDEMERIATGLSAVPDSALEKDRATALVEKIRGEQRRVKAEREAAAKEVAARPPPPTGPSFPAEPAPAPPPPEDARPDAGPPSEPWAGMDEKTFLSLFGTCVRGAPAMALPDGGAATAHRVLDDASCQKRFGAPSAETFFLFGPQGLWGRTHVTTVVKTVDAGAPAAPPAAKEPPPPPPVMLLPGAPLPEGYQRKPE